MQEWHNDFANTILNSITRFLVTENYGAAVTVLSDGLTDILDDLVDYQEEGARLYPELLIVRSIDPFLSALEATTDAGGVYRIRIDKEGALAKETVKRVLKRCSMLAQNGWIIYLSIAAELSVEYGIISIKDSLYSPSLYRHIFAEGTERTLKEHSFFYVRPTDLRRIEFRSHSQKYICSLQISSMKTKLDDPLRNLADSIVISTLDYQDECRNFVLNLLEETLRESHGALIGVITDTLALEESEDARSFMAGGVRLSEAVDIAGMIKSLLNSSDREEALRYSNKLTAHREIIKGMIKLDGITILSTRAKVVAYNVFVDLREMQSARDAIGGARSRAFDRLKELTDLRVLDCSFFRSQDGAMKYYRTPEVRDD